VQKDRQRQHPAHLQKKVPAKANPLMSCPGIVCVRERERESERERKSDRERAQERESARARESERARERESERARERHTHTEK